MLCIVDLLVLVYGSFKFLVEVSGLLLLQLDKVLGLFGNVFCCCSGMLLFMLLLGLFIQLVFVQEVGKGIEQVVNDFIKDDWVFGVSMIDVIGKVCLQQQVLVLYQIDYIKVWDDLLVDLELQLIVNIQDVSVIVVKLFGFSLLLKVLFGVVCDNIYDLLCVLLEDGVDKVLDVVKKVVEKKVMQSVLSCVLVVVVGLMFVVMMEKLGDVISVYFDMFNKFSEGVFGVVLIDQMLGVFDQFSKMLLIMIDFSSVVGQFNLQLLLVQQVVVQLLLLVFGWVVVFIGKSQVLVVSGIKGVLDDQFQQVVVKDCVDFICGCYLFVFNGKLEILLQNFVELFGYGGQFDSFYKQMLEKLVDVSGCNWQWKSGFGVVSGLFGMLVQMQLVDLIKQMYFCNGSVMFEVDFIWQVLQFDVGIGKLVIVVDGQKYEYMFGGVMSVVMKWFGLQFGQVFFIVYDIVGNLISSVDYQGDWVFFCVLQVVLFMCQLDLCFIVMLNFGGCIVKFMLQVNNFKNLFFNIDV